MCFMIFESERKSFYDIKTGRLKSRKIEIFPKGLVHGFGPKLTIFPCFFLDNVGHENVLMIFQSERTSFYDIKT